MLPRRDALRTLAAAPALFGPGVLLGCGTAGTTMADPTPGLDGAALRPSPTTDGGMAVDPTDGRLVSTPECRANEPATQAQTEGPFFKATSPQRSSLIEASTKGQRLGLEGFVVSRSCQVVSRALVDLWHCDDAGDYDNSGFRFRGHQLTGTNGQYRFETIAPGLYPGRTRHFHVKVQAPNRPVLTTQLYFQGDAANAGDSIFRPELTMRVTEGPQGMVARFTFVIDV